MHYEKSTQMSESTQPYKVEGDLVPALFSLKRALFVRKLFQVLTDL